MLNKTVETLVVGLDFSPYSKIVLKQAKVLAKFFNTKMVLVHAVQEPIALADGYYYPYLPMMSVKDHVKRLKTFYNVDDTVKCVAEYGSPAKVLMEAAGRYVRPMIVAGYKGHSNITEFFFGSTAQEVALKAKVPVWIQRGNKIRSLKHFLIAHDLTKKSSRSIRFVKEMENVKPLKYQVYSVENKPLPILDVRRFIELQNRIRKYTRTAVKNLKQEFRNLPFLLASGDVTEKIAKQSKNFDAVVMTHYHGQRPFSRSETVKVLKKAPVPLLVVH